MPLAPLNVPALLRRHGLRPDKSLGQNFLVEPAALQKVIDAAGLAGEDSALEIGPGLGGLTRLLAAAARQVTAVELDARLLPALREVLAGFDNVWLIEGDILAQNPATLMGTDGYLVVANIPYYITSAVIRHLLEASRKPSRIVLTVQREVAGRICAAPGEMSLLALSVQVYGQPTVTAHIPAEAFYPPPKVDSAVIRIDLYPEPLIPAEMLGNFFTLCKAGFSQKRKTLRNALSAGLGWPPPRAEELLRAAGVDPQRRAETLSIAEWRRLVEVYRG